MNPLISLRLMDHHLMPALMDELLEVLARQPGAVDEVWLCSEYGFPPLDKIAHSGEKMIEAAERFRSLGIATSLQISNSLGHGEYLKGMDFGGQHWRRMTGPDGTVNPYANCPTDPEFLDYIRESTRLYSRFRPSILWVDDDLRMHNHMPVSHGCFCDGCMATFSAQYGADFTRERMWAAIHEGDPTWRQRWIAFNEQRLSGVTRAIMEGCLKASPDTIGGFQHCGSADTLYSGRTWHSVYDVMHEMTGKGPMSRPGGGFYHDGAPRAMLDKLLYLEYQLRTLPGCVAHARPEVENLPHLAGMGKSAHGTCVESTMYLAYGMDGLSYASLMLDNESPLEHEWMLSRFAAWRPYWKKLIAATQGTDAAGLSIPLGENYLMQSRGGRAGDFFWDSPSTRELPPMLIAGLPIHWQNGADQPYVVNGALARSLSESELRQVFATGALVDSHALEALEARGLLELAGVRAEEPSTLPVVERFEDVPGAFSARVRRRSTFSGCCPAGEDVRSLVPMECAADVQVIARYESHDGRDLGISSLIVRNLLGGLTAAIGYLPWSNQISAIRREAMLYMAGRLFGGALPARVDGAWPVVIAPRLNGRGRVKAVTLLNASIDETAPLTLSVSRPVGARALLMRPERGDLPLIAQGGRVELGSLPPWGVATVVFTCERGGEA